MQKQSCLIIAGEKSGEEHAQSFLPYLMKNLPDYNFYGFGGDDLANLGLELITHLKHLSTWGITGAIKKIPFYLNLLNEVEQEVVKRETKVAILIDYQSFNLKLAERLHSHGVKILYYVAPQAWGWKPWRAKKLKKYVHTLFTIIPFEKTWFKERGVTNVISAPHPISLNHAEDKKGFERKAANLSIKENIQVLLLPGSRNSEVKTLLPIMIDAIKLMKGIYPELKTTLIKSDSVKSSYYAQFADEIDNLVSNTHLIDQIKSADLSLAASGTVTLLNAYFHLPTVVLYKTDLFTSFIIRTMQIYFGPAALANIYLNQGLVFPELIQEDANSVQVFYQLKNFIFKYQKYKDTIEKLKKIDDQMNGEGIDIKDYMLTEIKNCYES